jgi:Enoyl-(Acyl carrier protein) reductase
VATRTWHYAASKVGVVSITRSAAQALAAYRNCICPGAVDTPLWKKIHAEWSELEGWQPGEACSARPRQPGVRKHAHNENAKYYDYYNGGMPDLLEVSVPISVIKQRNDCSSLDGTAGPQAFDARGLPAFERGRHRIPLP